MKHNPLDDIDSGRMATILRNIGGAIANRAFRRALADDLRKRFMANWQILLISASIATVVFFWIHERPAEEFTRMVEVKVTDVPTGMSVGTEPRFVKVVFKGTRDNMIGLDISPATVYVKYSQILKARRGRLRLLSFLNRHDGADAQADNEVELSTKYVNQGATRGFGNADVVRIEPKTVRIVSEEQVGMYFEIEPPRLKGTPVLGYHAEVADYSPKGIEVTGGGNRLKVWRERGLLLQLSPVDVEGRERDFPSEAIILPPKGDDAMGVSFATNSVQVKVHVTRQLAMFDIDDIPVRLSFPQGFTFHDTIEVQPDKVRMTLKGTEEQIRKIGRGDVAVYAEVSTNAIPAGTAIPVTLVSRTPQDKSIVEVNIEPSTVLLTATDNCAAPEAETPAGMAGGQRPMDGGPDGSEPPSGPPPAETGAGPTSAPISSNDAAQQPAPPNP